MVVPGGWTLQFGAWSISVCITITLSAWSVLFFFSFKCRGFSLDFASVEPFAISSALEWLFSKDGADCSNADCHRVCKPHPCVWPWSCGSHLSGYSLSPPYIPHLPTVVIIALIEGEKSWIWKQELLWELALLLRALGPYMLQYMLICIRVVLLLQVRSVLGYVPILQSWEKRVDWLSEVCLALDILSEATFG